MYLWRVAAIGVGMSLWIGASALPGPLPPQESVQLFSMPADLRLDQVLAEPVVKQPVSINFDERGRLWVVQYLQYPNPAGLTMMSRDKFWRIVYDRVPPPPPHHVQGRDKITIHEDTDGDGVFDKHTTFLEGLNIATAAVRGRGGVWVLNPPYLLFYPTKDNADLPTGEPVVHLQGFGLEDTHSVVNSLCWGPDGWLYAAQGSTVTAKVQRPGDKEAVHSVGQLIWRYHPETRRYEVFAEGGGNAFGVEIDNQGRVFSGHNGGNTRGFHYVQGGYSRKTFDKHGSLSSPFAFGYFEPLKHHSAPRFSHTFIKYEADALPEKYHGKMIAVSPMLSEVLLTEMTPHGSSFQTRDLEPLITSKDKWFRPVDIKLGPDGAVYIADWYDGQINHYRNHEGKMDHDTGRIYRLAARGAKPAPPVELHKKSTPDLIALLQHPNRWHRQTALRLLGDRRDASAVPTLVKLLHEAKGQLALEALWALNLSGGFAEQEAMRALDHAEPWVRAWTVRLLGDNRTISAAMSKRLVRMAGVEIDVHVRSQLACTARRVPAEQGLEIVRELSAHAEDAGDPHLPLLLWWALEAHCGRDADRVIYLFHDPAVWRQRLVEEAILARLMRRFAQAGTRKDLLTCTKLLHLAPDAKHGQALLGGLEEAFRGRSLAALPPELLKEVARFGGGSLAWRVRLGDGKALAQAFELIRAQKTPLSQRIELIGLMAEVKQPACVAVLLPLLASTQPEAIRKASLTSLQAYQHPDIAKTVLGLYDKLQGETREVADALLASRREWAGLLLQAVDDGRIDKDGVAPLTLRKMLLHRDERIAALVRKHWGEIKGATTVQMEKDIGHLAGVLKAGSGNPYPGKKLYLTRCQNCHALHSRGGNVGPDLTPYKRDETSNLLLHIVNPSAEIREGYEYHTIVTESGRILTGVLVEKDSSVVILRTAEGQTVVLPREEIADMNVSGISLMPEGLLRGLAEQEVRDLFAYLRSSQPLND